MPGTDASLFCSVVIGLCRKLHLSHATSRSLVPATRADVLLHGHSDNENVMPRWHYSSGESESFAVLPLTFL